MRMSNSMILPPRCISKSIWSGDHTPPACLLYQVINDTSIDFITPHSRYLPRIVLMIWLPYAHWFSSVDTIYHSIQYTQLPHTGWLKSDSWRQFPLRSCDFFLFRLLRYTGNTSILFPTHFMRWHWLVIIRRPLSLTHIRRAECNTSWFRRWPYGPVSASLPHFISRLFSNGG